MQTKAVTKTGEAQKSFEALEELARRYGMDSARLTLALRSTVLPKVKDPNTKELREPTVGEVLGFVVTANAYKLNPFLKEIYAFPDKKGGMTPIVGVDGWLRLMHRNPLFNGIEFSFGPRVERDIQVDQWENGRKTTVEKTIEGPEWCTARVHVKGKDFPFEVTEFFSECYRPTEPWNTMPYRMMRNKVTVQGGRVAFGFGGIYDEDEARDQAPRDVDFENVQMPDLGPVDAPPESLGDVTKKLTKTKRSRPEPEPDETEDVAAAEEASHEPDPLEEWLASPEHDPEKIRAAVAKDGLQKVLVRLREGWYRLDGGK